MKREKKKPSLSSSSKSKKGIRKQSPLNLLKKKNKELRSDNAEFLKNLQSIQKENQRYKIEIESLEETIAAMEKLMEFSREQAIDLDKEIKARESLLDLVQMESIERNKEANAFANVLELSRVENIQRDSRIKQVQGQQQKSNELIQLLMLQKNLSTIVNSSLEISEILNFLFDKLIKLFKFSKIIFEEIQAPNNLIKVQKVYIQEFPDEELKKFSGKEISFNLREKGLAKKIMDMNSLYFFKEPFPHAKENSDLEEISPIYEEKRIFIPIVSQNQTIALVQVSLPKESPQLDEKQKELFEGILSLITPAIKNAKLYEEIKVKTSELEKKNKMIAKDLKMAQKLQTGYLSVDLKKIEHLDIDIHFQPMIEVGGDIYDMTIVKPAYYRIFIADATGHGIQAALTTMIVKTEYDKLKSFDMPPNLIIKYLNNEFVRSYYNLNIFFSCLVLDIDIEKNLLLYSSAGHPDQYLITSQQVIPLQTAGKMVGMKDNLQFQVKEFPFNRNDKLVLFTDGLFEEFSQKEELFGEERLLKMIQDYKSQPHETFIQNILKEVKRWIGKNQVNDDITLIGIERKF